MTEPRRQDHVDAVVAAQDSAHSSEWDYDIGSPHLRHDSLRTMVERRLTDLVTAARDRGGSCRVLEVGAGHGTFTQCLLEAGATVTVTEASSDSAEHLRRVFGDQIDVLHDTTGEQILDSNAHWDLAVMTAVLHHIPDYLGFLDRLTTLIVEDGAIFTVQDPLYYPRMSRTAHVADRGSYFAWRLVQGNYARGLATRLRRLRGVYVDTNPSDLVEYHVVRDGVDEEAIAELLRTHFDDVEIFRYWSTQAPALQRLGQRTRLTCTFGIEATRHRIPGVPQ
jgi:phospholipid N-methyltransferase